MPSVHPAVAKRAYRALERPSPEIIENLANKYAGYLNITYRDSVWMAQDPAGRDKALQASAKRPDVVETNTPTAYLMVPIDGNGPSPDEYLAHADSEIAKLTEKEDVMTMDDHLLRFNATVSAVLVFIEYKVNLPYAHFSGDVTSKITSLGGRIHRKWRDQEYGPFPGLQSMPGDSPEPTTPASKTPISPGERARLATLEPLTSTRVEEYLDKPSTLLGVEFLDTNEDGGGFWVLKSFSQSLEGIDFVVDHKDCDYIPMDVDSMRTLLSSSVVL